MKEYTIGAFAKHLALVGETLPILELEILEEIAVVIEKAAKEKIGHYQDDAGPFSVWSLLADSTLDDRTRQGFPADEPGLRTGEMRDSIDHKVMFPTVEIGSDDDKLLWFEFGTVNQPPRSVLGGAAFEKTPEIVLLVGKEVEGYLSSGKVKR